MGVTLKQSKASHSIKHGWRAENSSSPCRLPSLVIFFPHKQNCFRERSYISIVFKLSNTRGLLIYFLSFTYWGGRGCGYAGMDAEDDLWESSLSLWHVGPGPWTGLQAWRQALPPAEPSCRPSYSTTHFRDVFHIGIVLSCLKNVYEA